jgi:transcriptional regulator with XRE-family HTH domain
VTLLREHPEALDDLTDFIAAYRAIGDWEMVLPEEELSPLTLSATQKALSRFFQQEQSVLNLAELRKKQQLSKVEAARGLRLSVDVWNKFEAGAIQLVSLTQQQLQRFASFFQVSADQFSNLLANSQPAFTLNRRQTAEAAQKSEQAPLEQSFAEAIARSTMPEEDRRFWLDA